jgi:FtsP/CotA-like multicopper oxidase with cupredoxin domain
MLRRRIMMDRRRFLRAAALTGSAVAGSRLANGLESPLALLDTVLDPSRGADVGGSALQGAHSLTAAGGPLYIPPTLSPVNLTLVARAHDAQIAPGVRSRVMTVGDGPISPTIRARAGERATITLRNQLDEPTILHWHGLRPPEKDDGHPRLAIAPGAEYRYDFMIDERPGTYWYHAHPHMRTAAQVHLGMAGLLIITDADEDALGLPSGDREVAIMLQDKRPAADGTVSYNVTMGHDMMEGLLGSAAYVNGVRTPRVEVDSAHYRLRVLGGANARIFRLALSNDRPLTLIGTDGGLLERPVSLPHMDLATGERADLLLDFSNLPVGTRIMLRSLAFDPPYRGMGGMGGMGGRGMGMGGGGMGMGGGVIPQGGAMDLMEFVVTRSVRDTFKVPTRLSVLPPVNEGAVTREREFHFRSAMMRHQINGRDFEMERIDERIPFGSTERWVFVNDGPFPHPVHMHAVQFRITDRTGGRGTLYPWEGGWKDTVLVYPGERVSVVTTFDRHRGRFLMHCHNLEHEDHGMMMNFAIE